MDLSIKKLNDWKSKWQNVSNVNIFDYISANIHPEDVLILSSLFFPKVIEVNGAIFLEKNYKPETYSLWVEKYGDDILTLEKMINHVHLYDIFAHCTDDIDDSVFENVGKTLQYSWEIYFKYMFPNKEIVVKYTNNENEYGPTLFVFQKALTNE
ncbi:MAG: hypothetical protein HND27_10775 [Bacteroidetes bacterium]|nr:hypothetical protein [Bacteroidota bacterium]MBV6462371.1 hypothetical protein [Flavobacteriales bacterium]NOG96245.1 hypothetical protein [Bacteroidota bacterium]